MKQSLEKNVKSTVTENCKDNTDTQKLEFIFIFIFDQTIYLLYMFMNQQVFTLNKINESVVYEHIQCYFLKKI